MNRIAFSLVLMFAGASLLVGGLAYCWIRLSELCSGEASQIMWYTSTKLNGAPARDLANRGVYAAALGAGLLVLGLGLRRR